MAWRLSSACSTYRETSSGERKKARSCSLKTASRSVTGILFRHDGQMYFGLLDGTAILAPQTQCATPAKRCRVRLAGARRPVLRAVRNAAHWSQRSADTMGGTSVQTQSLSGLRSQFLPSPLERV